MFLKDPERQQEEGEGGEHAAAQVPSGERPGRRPGDQRTALLRRPRTQVRTHHSRKQIPTTVAFHLLEGLFVDLSEGSVSKYI